MTPPAQLEITVDGASVATFLHRPKSGEAEPLPTVLLCGPLPVEAERDAVDDLHDQIIGALLDAGVAVVTFRPRLTSLGDNGMTLGPQDSIDDASAVFRALLQRPDVDRDRVGVIGYSSAAIVAACLAGRSPRFLAGLCLLAPASVDSLLQLASEGGVGEPLPERFVTALRELDPIADAATHDRPTLIIHGAADRTFASDVGLAYHRRLLNAGHQTRLVLVPRADHGFGEVETRVACLEQVLEFFGSMVERKVGTPGG